MVLNYQWYGIKHSYHLLLRYKNDLTDDQKDFLLETVRQRFHPLIGPEIRRELLS